VPFPLPCHPVPFHPSPASPAISSTQHTHATHTYNGRVYAPFPHVLAPFPRVTPPPPPCRMPWINRRRAVLYKCVQASKSKSKKANHCALLRVVLVLAD
jgi:hypothetical protein